MADQIDFIERARTHGLELRPDSLEVDDIGLDFVVGFANDLEGKSWVLRVPRRPDVWSGAEHEARILELVESRLPVAVPRWVVRHPSLIAYRRVPGTQLISVQKTGEGGVEAKWSIEPAEFPDTLVQSLADLVATLQAIEAPDDLPVPATSEIRATTRARIEKAAADTRIHAGRLGRWQRWLDDDALWADQAVLTHGELHPLHLLIAGEPPRVAGVLDWTEAAFTDPAVDFAVFYKSFGDGVLDRIIASFERTTGQRQARLRERAVLWESLFPISLLEFALRAGSAEYREQAEAQLASV